jgi:hypothetical protein
VWLRAWRCLVCHGNIFGERCFVRRLDLAISCSLLSSHVECLAGVCDCSARMSRSRRVTRFPDGRCLSIRKYRISAAFVSVSLVAKQLQKQSPSFKACNNKYGQPNAASYPPTHPPPWFRPIPARRFHSRTPRLPLPCF